MMARLLIYDGKCSFCSGITKRFESRAYAAGVEHVDYYSRIDMGALNSPESVIYERDDRFHTESDAIIRYVADLGGVWTTAIVFLIIPRFIRDAVYRLVARNRNRLKFKF